MVVFYSSFKNSALASGILALFCQPAFAYIDPGTFSIVVQAIVAGIIGIGATFRYWIHRVRSVFSFLKPEDPKVAKKTGNKKDG